MRLSPWIAAGLLVAVSGCGANREEQAPQADAVRVLSSNGVKAVIDDAQAEIERAIGRPLSIEFSTAATLKTKIEQGEPFDVAILTPALLHELTTEGHVVADSQLSLARAGVGVAARTGAPKADVSTADALKRTLLEARSVAFTAEGQSRRTIEQAFEEMGIAEAMRPKVILTGPMGGPAAVAKGEAELAMTLISEILPIEGVELLGPLPDGLQQYVSFAAARGAHAKDAAAADALLRTLGGPTVASALERHGMESVE
jgi:molybdate transport system substrate-binding protein